MKVEIFTLCDYAARYGDSLCIFGTGEIFHSNKPGYVIRHKFLAYRIRFEPEDKGKFQLKVEITDDSGKSIAQFTQDEYEPIRRNIYGFDSQIGIIYLETLVLQKCGVYSAALFGNNEKLASIPIFVFQSRGAG